jgi:diacylglycerol kinase (ATP)
MRRAIPAIRAAFAAHDLTAVHETSAPGDEEILTRRSLDQGAETIVAVGGDGTCSRIADTIIRHGSSCALAVVAAGTGNDFAKTLGVAGLPPKRIAELVVRGEKTAIDVGRADGIHFLNSCGFGFDPSVLEASNKVRFLKGNAVYIYSALRQLVDYRGVVVSASGAGGTASCRMLMVTVSNGKSLGGAFKIAPRASVIDGKLDVCFFADGNISTRLRLFLGALRGTHLDSPEAQGAQTPQLTLSFEDAPTMEVDGELRTARGRAVEIRCAPRALAVIAAPGALT